VTNRKLNRYKAQLDDSTWWEKLLGAVLVLIVALAVVVLSGLVTLFAWNTGVVGLVAACGGTVTGISLSVAIATNFIVLILSRVFRRRIVIKAAA